MRTRNISKKLVSLALTIAIIGTGSGINTLANSVNDGKNSQKAVDNKVTVVKELIDERTENSNTYLLSDGSKKTELFLSNIRYEKDGQLKDYENEIVDIGKNVKKSISTYGSGDKSSYKYVNKSSDNKAYFSDDIEDGIMLSHGKYILKMIPVIEEENDDINKDDKNTSQSNENNEFECIKNEESNELKYISESKNMEYQYSVNNCGVKENIVLNEKPETNIFEYKIETKNLYLKKQENDKGLLVYDKNTNKIIGTIEAPFLVDADGKEDYKSVEYKLEKDGENEVLKVIVSNDYFENEATKYPVTIDPTMVWMFDYLTTASVWSVDFQQNVNMHNHYLGAMNNMISSYPYNSEEHVYLDTSNLLTGSALVGSGLNIRGKYIESASLNLYESSYRAPYQVGTLELRTAKDSWNPDTITWNNKPGASEEVLLEEKFTGVEGTRHCLDITKWVQDITDEQIENNGLVFTAKKGGAALFYGPEAHYIQDENGKNSESRHMSIYLTYRDFEPYDASININAEYDKQSNSIITSIEDDNKLKEGVAVTGYKIFTRKDNALKFSAKYKGTDISEDAEINASNVDECIDIRAAVLYSDGTVKVSNIVTLEKTENGDSDDGGNSFEITSKDTDGDGLEDGYEIWDFKTMWNTETVDSTEDNPKYEQDTDGDGLPDGYEVFTLGTDPAVANEENADSDNDGWTDLKEYQKGTDPWLYDSDFDGLRDKDDVGDNNPRKTDNPRLKGTDRSVASAAKVHKGLYDREYSENENGVTVTYIANIYRGDIKSIYSDYGDAKINKRLKYFYDAKGNNTAIVEQYDDNDTQTICITYTYDENGNVEFICDQQTKYTMEYNSDSKITNLQVGERTLVSYEYSHTQNDSGNESGESTGDSVENTDEQITYYGTGDDRQKVRTVTTEYKADSEDDAAVAEKTEVFYNDEKTPSYVTTVNSSGQMLNLTDNTESAQLAYNYEYNDNTTRVTRSDGFIKEVVQNEDEENKKSTRTTKYEYKALDDKKETLVSKIETDSSDSDKIKNRTTLYNGDVLSETMSDDGKSCVTDLYSDKYKKNILKYNSVEDDSTHRTFDIEKYGEKKNIDYTYDSAGNITKIKTDGKLTNAYEYDAHGRLTWEYDYDVSRAYEYGYSTTGNVEAKHTYVINDNGRLVEQDDGLRKYSYGNGDWPDQLTKYCGKEITYDSSGNPKEYYNGMSFNWYRGRQLQEATLANGKRVTYKYNEDGLRTYKDTEKTTTTYEWDETKLIRETVTYKKTGKKYDIWYMYDSGNNVIGFEYSQLSELNETLKTTRIYYEKNLQGDVTGLLDARGAEIASYTYDAWGNVITDTEKSFCYEGYEVPFELNHVLYRGYYYDGSCTDTESDTNLYYLQSRYYDAEVGRFVNADDVSIIGLETSSIYKDNLYIYCNSNPIKNIDSTGYWLLNCVCAIAGAAFFGGVTYLIGKIFGLSGKNLAIMVAALSAAGATLAGILGPKFLAKAAPELVKWFKNVERNTKVFGPNKSGNIIGVVLFNAIKIMIHRPHIGKHNFYHIQIEVKIAKSWKAVARIPFSARK